MASILIRFKFKKRLSTQKNNDFYPNNQWPAAISHSSMPFSVPDLVDRVSIF